MFRNLLSSALSIRYISALPHKLNPMRPRSVETIFLMSVLAGASEVSATPRPVRETSAMISCEDSTKRFIRTALRPNVDARRRGQVSGR